MSRFCFSSSLSLFQSVTVNDSDATSSSASSSSAINNSSNSLSLSPLSSKQPPPQQSNNISTHLRELQREIKEEEDEIFADINSLINNRSNLYSSFDDDTDDFEDNVAKTNDETVLHSDYLQGGEDPGLDYESTRVNNNNNYTNSHNQYYGDHNYDPCNRVTGQQNQEEGDEQEQQHDYLDQEQHEQQLDNYQAIQGEDIQQLTNNLPKPCVFFLEGNCRRSDCKYSHDLSSITCKYWVEGFCFKGEMCPFLHSFTQKGQVSGLSDDELSLTKGKLNPTFVIESEADFPSLPLDAPNVILSASSNKVDDDSDSLTKTIKNQILSSNPAVVFKTTKKKRKKG